MSLRLPARVLTALFSVWLTVCLVEPAAIHTCVMHGGVTVSAPGGVSGHSASHAAHSHHAAAHSTSVKSLLPTTDHSGDSDGQSRQCSCLGDCSVGSSSSALLAAPIRLSLPTFVQPRTSIPVFRAQAYESPRFLLPFPNGPPLTV